MRTVSPEILGDRAKIRGLFDELTYTEYEKLSSRIKGFYKNEGCIINLLKVFLGVTAAEIKAVSLISGLRNPETTKKLMLAASFITIGAKTYDDVKDQLTEDTALGLEKNKGEINDAQFKLLRLLYLCVQIIFDERQSIEVK